MAVTTTKGVIKMPAEGDSVTMHVTKCEVVQGQFDEQVKFTDTRGDQLFLPRKSADRQLLRIGFGEGEGDTANVFYGDVDGNTLVFTRDHNDKAPLKPYWGIRRVVDADVANRPSLVEAAKREQERVRVAKGLPREELSNTIGKLPFDDEVPPPRDEDSPYDDTDGMPPQKLPPAASTLTAEQANKEGAINAAYARAYAFVLGVQGAIATADSVQAGCATVLIAYQKAGIV